MPIIPILAMTTLSMTTLSVVRPAAETGAPKIEACLSDRDMREEIEEHRVVQPIVAFRAAGTGEKIRAKLCKTETGLVYLITALGHDGHALTCLRRCGLRPSRRRALTAPAQAFMTFSQQMAAEGEGQ